MDNQAKNPEQIKRLVELMEENISLTTTKTGWKEVVEGLNSLGPPVGDAQEWQKVWCDLMFKVKKKLLHNRRECEATGGGLPRQEHLNDVDESVAKILSLKESIDPSGSVFGCDQTATKSELNMLPSSELSSDNIPSTLSASGENNKETSSRIVGFSSPPENSLEFDLHSETKTCRSAVKKIDSKSKIINLLQKQIDIQEGICKGLKKSLGSIEIYLKATCRYKWKMLYLKEKKLQLFKLEMKRKKKQRIEENKLKIMELEIQKRMLAIEEKKMQHLMNN